MTRCLSPVKEVTSHQTEGGDIPSPSTPRPKPYQKYATVRDELLGSQKWNHFVFHTRQVRSEVSQHIVATSLVVIVDYFLDWDLLSLYFG